jgi:hypothetical protein
MMNNRKNYAWGIAVLTSLFLAGSLTRSPESQAKGAYSTPVTVMNTTANPASTLDAGTSSRIPYVSTQIFTCAAGGECVPLFTAAPSGFRLVIENVSGDFKLLPGTTIPPNGELGFNNGVFPAWGFSAVVGPTNGPNTFARFSQPVKAYADPVDGQPLVRVDGNWSSFSQTVTLTGYLINCSLTPCPAIQH